MGYGLYTADLIAGLLIGLAVLILWVMAEEALDAVQQLGITAFVVIGVLILICSAKRPARCVALGPAASSQGSPAA